MTMRIFGPAYRGLVGEVGETRPLTVAVKDLVPRNWYTVVIEGTRSSSRVFYKWEGRFTASPGNVRKLRIEFTCRSGHAPIVPPTAEDIIDVDITITDDSDGPSYTTPGAVEIAVP